MVDTATAPVEEQLEDREIPKFDPHSRYGVPCWANCGRYVSRLPGSGLHCSGCQRRLNAGWKHCELCGRWFPPGAHPEPLGIACRDCKARHEAEAAAERTAKLAERGSLVAIYAWRGYAIAKFEGEESGTYTVREERTRERWPASKVVDFDRYVDGWTREQVKGVKAAIKRAHSLYADPPRLTA